jgi:hypothetical protein
MQQVKIKHKHQVWMVFFSLPSFRKHIGKSIQLEAKYFHKLSTGIRNIVINELLLPISIYMPVVVLSSGFLSAVFKFECVLKN